MTVPQFVLVKTLKVGCVMKAKRKIKTVTTETVVLKMSREEAKVLASVVNTIEWMSCKPEALRTLSETFDALQEALGYVDTDAALILGPAATSLLEDKD